MKATLPFCFPLLAFSSLYLPLAVTGQASSQPPDSVHNCHPFDYAQWERDRPHRPAAKRLVDLIAAEPRTVRLIYFLPNDRDYRAGVVDSMEAAILHIQKFFTEQMQAHGYGNKTFPIEIDEQGEPVVHRIDGQHPEIQYFDNTLGSILDEINPTIDPHTNIYVILIDNSSNLIGNGGQYSGGTASRVGKNGGIGVFPVANIEWGSWDTPAHELGHALGLEHDFNDDAFIMSYGNQEQKSLSACNAGVLSVHPYFDSSVPGEDGPPPEIELLSPDSYPAGTQSIPIRLKTSSSVGLHQVMLFVQTAENPYRLPIDFAVGSLEVKACLGLAGEEETVVEFDYDGIIPSGSFSSLSNPDVHSIGVQTFDKEGNSGHIYFDLLQVAPQRIRSFEGGQFVVFSPDGASLVSASSEGIIKLWDVSTGENTTTFEGSVFAAFSPDGTTIVSASDNGRIKLWDVSTGEEFSAFMDGSPEVLFVEFSPDGNTIASGSYQKVELWDVASGQITATLEHPSRVDFVAFSPDGATLVSKSHRFVHVWDVATRTEISTLEGDGVIAFSPDGATLAYQTGEPIRLWDIAAKQEIGTINLIALSAMAIAPDGATLASGHQGGDIVMWDMESQTYTGILTGNREKILSLSFSPDGTRLASGSNEGTVELFDTSEWTKPRPRSLTKTSGDEQQGPAGSQLDQPLVVEVRDQIGNPLPGAQVTFTVKEGDGKLERRFAVVKATTDAGGRAESTLTLGVEPGTNVVEVSVTGLDFLTFNAVGVGTSTAVMGGDYRRWHLPQGATLRLGKGPIGISDRALSFSPDGRSLAVASDLGIWLYDSASLNSLALLPTGMANSLAFSPDGTTLVSTSERDPIKLWDVETGQNTASLDYVAGSVAFSPDGTILASGSTDYTVRLWDLATGTNTATLSGHQTPVLSLAFSPNGSTLASGSEDYEIRLWDVETGQNTATLSFGQKDFSGWHISVNSVAFSPDGTTLAFGSRHDETIMLWDVATGNAASLSGHTDRIKSVAFSPDGTILASGSFDGRIKLWDVSTGTRTATLSGHRERVNSIAFSPEGDLLASGSGDATVKLWEVATGTNTATLPGHSRFIRSVAFSPDGTMLASGSNDRTVKLWEVATGENTATLEGFGERVRTLAFSPDGPLLASGSDDGLVKLWNVEMLTNSATLEGHAGWVHSVAFSPDGIQLASGAGDGLVKLWDPARFRGGRWLGQVMGYCNP